MTATSTEAPGEAPRVLGALVEHTREGLAYFDAALRFVYVNPAYAAFVGRSREELVGAALFDVFPDPDGARLFEQARASGSPATWTERAWAFADQTERGTTYWTWTVAPDLGPDGALRGFAVSTRDVTEPLIARDRARAHAERLRLALDAAHMAAWDWDVASGEVQWNDEHYRMLGYVPHSFSPSYAHWADRLHPDDRVATEARVSEAVARGGEYEADFRVVWPDKTVRWIEARGRMEHDTAGRPQRQYGVMTDITARKNVEQKLREEGELKSQFLAALSHELRNPLAPISTSLYVLDHVAPTSPEAEKAKAVIGRQVAQLSRLVDDLLDLTRIARGKVRVEIADVPLAALLADVAADYRPLFDRAGVSLELAPPAEEVAVRADPLRLAQIIGNVLQNASKFTPRGGHTVLRATVERGAAEIRIADDGVGMSVEVLARVFEPFAQADVTLDRSRGGLGLGLALARGLVELHGGTISVRSPGIGHGTEVVVRLPLAARSAASTRAPEREGSPSRRVLVVEDNVDAAEMLAETLRLKGHEVLVAHDGRSGLDCARAHPPAIMFCDLGLPGLDGFAVARAIRSDAVFDGVSLVALSGYAQPEDVAKSREAGFDAHLAKPPRIASIDELLRQPPRRVAREHA